MITKEEADYIVRQVKNYLDNKLNEIASRGQVVAHVFEKEHMKSLNGGTPLDQATFREYLRLVGNDITETKEGLYALDSDFKNHVQDKNNPHEVTAEQVGLGNVDNTRDIDKPISNDTQDALDEKADKDDTYTKEEIDSIIATAFQYKGSVADYDSLPTENNKVGDVYNLLDTGANYAWDGIGWDKLSELYDFSHFATKDELEESIADEIIDRTEADEILQAQIDLISNSSTEAVYFHTYTSVSVLPPTSIVHNGTYLLNTSNNKFYVGVTKRNPFSGIIESVWKIVKPTTFSFINPSDANSYYRGESNVFVNVPTSDIADNVNYINLDDKKIYAYNADESEFVEITDDADLSGLIPIEEKGAVDGVATLGSDGKVPTEQLPAADVSYTVDFQTSGTFATDLMMYGTAENPYHLQEVSPLNIDACSVKIDGGEAIDLITTGGVPATYNVSVRKGQTLTWLITRTTDNSAAAIGVKFVV